MKRTDITAIFADATPEQIQQLMDLNGQDINNARDAAQKAAAAAQPKGADPAELQAAQDKAAQLEKELGALKLSNQLKELRETVAREKNVPVELLTGETTEACQAQADGILAFAKQQTAYPALKDGGEVTAPKAGTTRESFAGWAADKI